jgi:hypothetical protein
VTPSTELNAFAGFLAGVDSKQSSSSTCSDNTKNSTTVKSTSTTVEPTPTNITAQKQVEPVFELKDSPPKAKKQGGKGSVDNTTAQNSTIKSDSTSPLKPNNGGDSSSNGMDSKGNVLTPSPSPKMKEVLSTEPKQGRSQPTLNSFFQRGAGAAKKAGPKNKANKPVQTSRSEPPEMTNGKSALNKETSTATADANPLQQKVSAPQPPAVSKKDATDAPKQDQDSQMTKKKVVFDIETPVFENNSFKTALTYAAEPGSQSKTSSAIVDLTDESTSSKEGGPWAQASSKTPPAKSKAIKNSGKKGAAKKSPLANNKLTSKDGPSNDGGGVLDEEQTRMWKRYARRQTEMLDRIKNNLKEESEDFDLTALLGDLTGTNGTSSSSDFPDSLVGALASLVQGR